MQVGSPERLKVVSRYGKGTNRQELFTVVNGMKAAMMVSEFNFVTTLYEVEVHHSDPAHPRTVYYMDSKDWKYGEV